MTVVDEGRVREVTGRVMEGWLAQYERALELRDRALTVLEEILEIAEGKDGDIRPKERATLAAKVLTQADMVLRQRVPVIEDGMAGQEAGREPVGEADLERVARLRAKAAKAAEAADE